MWLTDSLLYTGPVRNYIHHLSPPQGLSSLGLPYLTDAQFMALCDTMSTPVGRTVSAGNSFSMMLTRVGIDQGGYIDL